MIDATTPTTPTATGPEIQGTVQRVRKVTTYYRSPVPQFTKDGKINPAYATGPGLIVDRVEVAYVD